MGICPICDRPVLFRVTANPPKDVQGLFNGDFKQDPFAIPQSSLVGNMGVREIAIEGTYPDVRPAATPADIPDNVRKALVEGLQARDAGLLPSVVYNMRKALERAVREQDTAGNGGLKSRIEKLAKAGRIPETLVKLAHTVRAEGNMEVHEDEDWSAEQVDELIEFATLLFTYLYTLPHRIQRIEVARGAPAAKR